MTLENCEIIASFVFLLLAKIVSFLAEYYRESMYNKSGSVLTSIPEKNEEEEVKKWVPKKKHEVLKAKYKCLKKLFQIYDASVIGILPEPYTENECVEDERRPKARRKRSHRTKTDACAGTTEVSSGDVTDVSDTDKASTIATSMMRELKKTQCSYTSTQMEGESSVHSTHSTTRYDARFTPDSRTNIVDKESEGVQVAEAPRLPQYPPRQQHPVPYLIVNEKPKLTRFQCFIQRLFGIKSERSYRNCVRPNGHIYAASDNNIIPPYSEKRRRRGLRFRKLRKPKKIQSESAIRGLGSPMILTYVQSVQKNCLMDTTPRQCPIVGCRMISYGIINYNDHLNLCHFTERKFVCHYCHEGFEQEYDKCQHENEHIGISKLNASLPSSSSRQQRVASITQTDPDVTKSDVPDDKLKKIVSFFDKISDPDQIISELKKNRYSESNLQSCKDTVTDAESGGESISVRSQNTRTVSCGNLSRGKHMPLLAARLPASGLPCNFCGENFRDRRQLGLHVDLEHRVHDKFSKFHSCVGIMNSRRRLTTEDSKAYETKNPSEDTLRRKSDDSLSYEPSTNIVYYTSMESLASKGPPPKGTQGVHNYRWEPGTKIIRV